MSGGAAVLAVTALETLCGLGVLALLGVTRSPGELGRRVGLAPLTGMAWAGILAATLATAGTRLSIVGLIGVTAVTCAAGVARLDFRRTPRAEPRPQWARRLYLAIAIPAVGTTAIVCAAALTAFHDKPLADYDGWAIWGMKAKAIAVLGSADADVFAGDAYERLHLEYPLLIPGLHALPLQAAHGYSSNTLILQSLAIGAAGLLAVWSLYRDRVRPALLLGFVAAIVALPALFDQLGTGYADVPLGVFVALGLGAAARWLVDDETGWLMLATLLFAAAALTKNEGLLFAASAYLPLFLTARGRRRAVAVSAAIVALAYAPWRAYTTVHNLEAPDYDLSSSFDLPWVAQRLDRAPIAARELLGQALEPRQFGLLLLLGLAAAALALGSGPRPLGLFAAGFALLSIAGLTWIYVLTPYDLAFYLSTNSDRVVVSLVLGLAVLSPLLIEESTRTLSARNGNGVVGTPR